MPRPRKPLELLAPSAFKKNAKRNEEMGRSLTQPEYPVLDMSRPPGDLSPLACDFWLELAPHLVGVVKVTDALMLSELCRVYAELREQREALAAEKYVEENLKGGRSLNPRIRQINALIDRAITLSSHFGLTPSTRSRVAGIEPPKEKTVFADV